LVSKQLCQLRGSEGDPTEMEKRFRALATTENFAEVTTVNHEELQKHGMNLFWNVGKGAVSKPRLVYARYMGKKNAGGDDSIDIAYVGKGITYDTGGLNIKVQMMEIMYGDKGGATAVMGAMVACNEFKVKKNIIFACAFAENAIGSECYKPSDIIKAMNGLEVEIGNTDAEGRLVLSDTATYI